MMLCGSSSLEELPVPETIENLPIRPLRNNQKLEPVVIIQKYRSKITTRYFDLLTICSINPITNSEATYSCMRIRIHIFEE